MRYFGSKASTVDVVVRLALDGRRFHTAADAFGGLATIGAAFRRHRLRVTTCDLLAMPHAFQQTRVACAQHPRYLKVRKHVGLESTESVFRHLLQSRNARSWFVREFSQERMFFTRENAASIAGAWDEIRSWADQGWLSRTERAHLVSSLINSMDACANTAGTYYAFLKDWDRRALKPFQLSMLPVATGLPTGVALQGDALASLRGKHFDVLYLDPPYNGRDYSRYYHLPESLAQLERPATNPFSFAGLPIEIAPETRAFRTALTLGYLRELVEVVHWKRLVVQYSDGAAVPLADLRCFLKGQGNMQEHVLTALGYTTTSRERRSRHYVFVIDKPAGASTQRTF